jgi:hypothetical protein
MMKNHVMTVIHTTYMSRSKKLHDLVHNICVRVMDQEQSSEKMRAQVHLTLKYCGKMAKL